MTGSIPAQAGIADLVCLGPRFRGDERNDSVLAAPERHRTAGRFDRLLGEREVGDLLGRRLLVFLDVAVLGAVVDRPGRPLGGRSRRSPTTCSSWSAHRWRIRSPPSACRWPSGWPARPWPCRRYIARLASIIAAAVSRSSGAVSRDPVARGAVGVEHVVGHQLDELHQQIERRLGLLGEEHVLGMQRDAVDLPGDQPRQPAGRRGRNELRVVDRRDPRS